MKPRDSQSSDRQNHLYQSRLDQQLNLQHPLFRLAGQIDWAYFDKEFGTLYTEDVGRPGMPTRLMVGLHYLKHAFNESDESVVERWVENPYWQYFCGYEFFQHEFPCHPTSMVKWRQRMKSVASRRCSKRPSQVRSVAVRLRCRTSTESTLTPRFRRRRSHFQLMHGCIRKPANRLFARLKKRISICGRATRESARKHSSSKGSMPVVGRSGNQRKRLRSYAIIWAVCYETLNGNTPIRHRNSKNC